MKIYERESANGDFPCAKLQNAKRIFLPTMKKPRSESNKCPHQVWKWSVKNYGREIVHEACLSCRPPARSGYDNTSEPRVKGCRVKSKCTLFNIDSNCALTYEYEINLPLFYRKCQDHVYIKWEYSSTMLKIKHYLRHGNTVNENKVSSYCKALRCETIKNNKLFFMSNLRTCYRLN